MGAAVMLVGAILQASAFSLGQLIAGRIVTGKIHGNHACLRSERTLNTSEQALETVRATESKFAHAPSGTLITLWARLHHRDCPYLAGSSLEFCQTNDLYC